MTRCLVTIGLLLGFATACEVEPEPPALACAQGDPVVELATRSVGYGELEDGDAIECGIPPQGGAPYSAFLVRAAGLNQGELGFSVAIVAVDAETGVEIGSADYDQRMVCANAGSSAGYWVSSEVHLRYEGWALEALEGRSANIFVRVLGEDGAEVETELLGTLELDF
jgi:hypothetical protein